MLTLRLRITESLLGRKKQGAGIEEENQDRKTVGSENQGSRVTASNGIGSHGICGDAPSRGSWVVVARAHAQPTQLARNAARRVSSCASLSVRVVDITVAQYLPHCKSQLSGKGIFVTCSIQTTLDGDQSRRRTRYASAVGVAAARRTAARPPRPRRPGRAARRHGPGGAT